MKNLGDDELKEALVQLQRLYPSDPDNTLVTDAVRMLASAGQFTEISQQIIGYVRTIAFLSSQRPKSQRLSSFPTERSLTEWRMRLGLEKDNTDHRLVDVLFDRVLNGLTVTIRALVGYVNLPRDVRKTVRASRILWLSKKARSAERQLELAIDALRRWQPKLLKSVPRRSALFAPECKPGIVFAPLNLQNMPQAISARITLQEIMKMSSSSNLKSTSNEFETGTTEICHDSIDEINADQLKVETVLENEKCNRPPADVVKADRVVPVDRFINGVPNFGAWTTETIKEPMHRHFIKAIEKVFNQFGFREFKAKELDLGRYRVESRTDWLNEMLRAGNIKSNNKAKNARQYRIKRA